MGFTFKQFHVDDDACGMKVGTDSILLGCLVQLPAAGRLLDIGAGCGLLSLMMAQRSAGQALITAVEIDSDACDVARSNVQRSPWANAIEIVNSDITAFSADHKFALIISNPPYFIDSLPAKTGARNIARHAVSLNTMQLLQSVIQLLSAEGMFWLILPPPEAEYFCQQANKEGLFMHQCIVVHSKSNKPIHRQIMGFAKYPALKVANSTIDVYDENNQYSRQFIALTQDFYLNR